MMRKFIAMVTLVTLLLATTSQTWAATLSVPEQLAKAEESLYGQAKGGQTGLFNRLDEIESDLYGAPQAGDLLTRTSNVMTLTTGMDGTGVSLIMNLNSVEWLIFNKLTGEGPLVTRLSDIEKSVFGSAQGGPVQDRVKTLVQMVWSSGRLETELVTMPVNTPVKVRLLSTVSSNSATVGSAVTFEVSENVTVNGLIVIPAGSQGTGTVTNVKKAGTFGRDADVSINFNRVRALDGTWVTLMSPAASTEKASTSELAAGASLLGLVALGPAGLLGGLVVTGKDLEVAKGTELKLLVAQQVSVTGLSLRPVGTN